MLPSQAHTDASSPPSSSSRVIEKPNYTIRLSQEPTFSVSPEFPSSLQSQLKTNPPSCSITLDRDGAGTLTLLSKNDPQKSTQHEITGFIYDEDSVPKFMASVTLNLGHPTLVHQQHGDLYFALYPNYILGPQHNQLKIPIKSDYVDGNVKLKGLKEILDYVDDNEKLLAPWRIKAGSLLLGGKISEHNPTTTVTVELPTNIQRNQLKAFRWNLLIYLNTFESSDNGVCPFVIYTSSETFSFSKRHFTENDAKSKKNSRNKGTKRKQQYPESDEDYHDDQDSDDYDDTDETDDDESDSEDDSSFQMVPSTRSTRRSKSLSKTTLLTSPSSKEISTSPKKSKPSTCSELESSIPHPPHILAHYQNVSKHYKIVKKLNDLSKITSEKSDLTCITTEMFDFLQVMVRHLSSKGQLNMTRTIRTTLHVVMY
ncbi:hypothetical protein C9374_000098 [Naegleria lovaniensis]|uniref:Uncharacterized protein n=1 Tax=Naegleria lovaniensis TaxID=51637 RepID=A0AA88KP20_NAELO|nr:uncharacterized protein C9374_000098 [Naegleria lovaniensis]KAG2388659.1 hypothetical protein C9374_000098 [Naegleria lovaniensis]